MLYRVMYQLQDTPRPDMWHTSNDTHFFLPTSRREALFNKATNLTRCKANKYMKSMQARNKELIYKVEPM